MKLKELIFGKTIPTVKVSQYQGSTQKWLPVADIQKGVVITKDGRFVKFVEVLPVNFYILSPLEQQNLIHYFRSYLKVAPDTLQILVVTQKADIESYVRRMRDFYDSEPVEGCRELIADNIREVTRLAASEAVTRRFFLVFQYDAGMKAREQSVEAIAQRLWEEEQNARRYLGMCGLEVLSSEYADNFLLETLNGCISKRTSRRQKLPPDIFTAVSKVWGGQRMRNFLREVRGRMKHRYQIRAFETEDGHFETENFSQKKISHRQKRPGAWPVEQDGAGWQVEPVPEPEGPEKKRMRKGQTKVSKKKEPKKRKPLFRKKPQEPEVSPLDSGAFTVPDILAPASADLGHRDYVEVDGVYHTYFYIAGYGYPSTVGGGWLCPVIESGEGINVSFTFTKQPREKILSKIAHATMLDRSRMREIGDTRQDYEEVDGAIDAGLYLKNEMNREGEDFYYMTTLIEVHGEDLETMEQRAAWLETRCTALGMTVRRCDYRNEEGFLSVLPLLALDPDLERKGRRNVLTSGVAASFPFSSFEICDQTGVMLGINQHNRSACMLDVFDSAKYSNGNMCVMGMSGAGKSFLMQLMALRYRQQGVQVFLLCPLKGHELRPVCEAIGGKYIKLSPTSRDCINIMEIRRSTLDTDSRLGRLAERGDSLLADKISKLHIFFSLLKSNITEEEKQYLDPALVECYRRFGITFNNASLHNGDGSPKAMPDLHDLYDLLREQPETKSLAVALARFATGSAANMGRQTNVDLQNKYIVLDISELPADLVSVGMFMALDFCWDKCKESRVEKKLLMLFELWTLIGSSSSPIAANFVLEIVKIIRGYGGAMVGETQDCHDYFALGDGQYGRAILSNSRIKIVLPMEEEEASFTQKVLGLSDEETLQIIRNRRGEGLLCAGHNRISVAFQPTPTEYDMITTSRQDLERQMMENQREDTK